MQAGALDYNEACSRKRVRLINGEAGSNDFVGRARRQCRWWGGSANGGAPLLARRDAFLQPAQEIPAQGPPWPHRAIAATRAASCRRAAIIVVISEGGFATGKFGHEPITGGNAADQRDGEKQPPQHLRFAA
ncbi:hypothetical protein GCM10007937_59810 [Mesorhizobium albiziae]|nr:hypothetical protein GCM10007937_59810 [Mesorhizobium albiziae]